MNKSMISVIMSTYNESPDYLEASIDSILNQTYTNLEFIIVIDNPQNEEIEKILNSYKSKDNRIKIIKNKKNIGLVRSLNRALEVCKGEYIARMDADDISELDRLEIQMNLFKEDKELYLVGSDINFIDENSNLIEKEGVLLQDFNVINKFLKYNNCMNHPTWLFKSDLIKQEFIDGYRDIPYAEDYDFICRIVGRGYKITNVDKKLLRYRVRSNGISRSNEYKQILSTQYVQKMYKKYLKTKIDIYNKNECEKILQSSQKNI